MEKLKTRLSEEAEILKARLSEEDVRGVVMSADGVVREFHRKGVIDLFSLITDDPQFLSGGMIADRVIGKGAALLLLKGGIAKVFAYVISQPALDLLTSNGVDVAYDTLQPHIINRKGDGICPVEQLTEHIASPKEAYLKIREFIQKQ